MKAIMQARHQGGLRPLGAEKFVHKFNVGQLVQFHPDRGERASAPPGLYEVTKQLPHNGHEYEYGIKSQYEEHERIAMESQLSSA